MFRHGHSVHSSYVSVGFLLCCLFIPPPSAERLPWEDCWSQKQLATLCCTPEAFPQHLHLFDYSICFQQGRTYAHCCEGDTTRTVKTRVLIYSQPKTATRSLEELFVQTPNVIVRTTHSSDRARSIYHRMVPPCLVITVSRNPFHRHPSQFFHYAVKDERWYTDYVTYDTESGELGPVEGADAWGQLDMSNFVWNTREAFLDEAMDSIRSVFFQASREFARTNQANYFFTNLGEMLEFDFFDFAGKAAPLDAPVPDYLLVHSESFGTKCSLLVLCFERTRAWIPALKPFFPTVRTLNRTHEGGKKWYGAKYKEFVHELIYSPYESAMMCTMDVMHLPFYRGCCTNCEMWGDREYCSSINPAP